MFNAIKRNKWTSDHVPIGYPQKCSSDQIKEVIQDLFDEKHRKLKNGKNELKERSEVAYWYEKPLGVLVLGLVIAVVAGYVLFKLGWS